MNQNCSNARYFGCLHCAKYGIPEKGRPDSTALIFQRDGESSDDNDGHRIGHIPFDPSWRFSMCYCSCRQSVVPGNLLSHTYHISPRGTAFLILKCAPFQPDVERRLAAIKLRYILGSSQLLRRGEQDVFTFYLSHGALVLNRRSRRGLDAGDLSSMFRNRLNSVSDKTKYRRSSNTDSAAWQAASSMKSERLRPSAVAARSINAFWLRLTRRLIFSARSLRDSVAVLISVFPLLSSQSVYMDVRTL